MNWIKHTIVFLIFPVLNSTTGAQWFLTGTNISGEDQLPGTQILRMEGDIASVMIEGIDRFMLKELEKSVSSRAIYWHRNYTNAGAYNESIAGNRKQLARILGLTDKREAFNGLELVGTTKEPALIAGGGSYEVYAVRWPAFGDVYGEGLLLEPKKDGKLGNIIAIPDADQTPEMIAGLADGVPLESQYARRLAESGFRVVIPVLINRQIQERPRPGSSSGAKFSNREYLYRPAFELGRHLIGYEIQKVLALVDWLSANLNYSMSKIGVIGWGEGGLISLYAGALDQRIDAVMVSGYFDSRQNLWQEPIDRNVFGLLEQFGDAELAGMVIPRGLVIEAAKGPELNIPPDLGGAPARLITPELKNVKSELERTKELVRDFKSSLHFIISDDGTGAYGTTNALSVFSGFLSPGIKISEKKELPKLYRKDSDPAIRNLRQMHEIDRHSQLLLRESPFVRKDFMKNLNTGSIEQYKQSAEWYRSYFYNEIIGRFDFKLLPPAVRTRKVYDEQKWTGYEVVMDVFPDVIAYGILVLPKDLKQGEKRPVVICQHGLEGRALDVVKSDNKNSAYHDFAAQLAEQGFITFAPQNLYIFKDRFRTLQRKGNPIKKTLFSVMVPQHQQIVDWLSTLPYVDPERIAFYGLSYGGKAAMRIPPLVKNYCLSICSGDFNEWIWKTASTRIPYSYAWSIEYEMFEFDLGNTFNHAEMAALIAPRPFMVERGMFDGVASNEAVGYEFAKVLQLYAAQLKIRDKCEIEFFVGPHAINGQGTFDFLHKHLNWPKER